MNLETLALVAASLSALGAVGALYFSWRANQRSKSTEEKMEKRNLIKERDDLLDRALQTEVTLDGLEIRILRLLTDWPSEYNEREISVITEHWKDIPPLSTAVHQMRISLKKMELTSELIDGMSNSIRENQILATDVSNIIREQFEERVKDMRIGR